MDDDELLRAYVRSESEEAFRGLVDRHLPMVYATARRMVGDAQLAEDLAQAAFMILAQKAASLNRRQVLGGWLYQTTRNLARHAIRNEQRRRIREQTAVAMQSLNAKSEPDHILEGLEPAMAELEDNERDVLVLRFLQARSLREVGHQFGINEDAARMRVNRALDRLREVFERRGIAVTSALLGTILAASTSEAVPASLASSITATALALKTAAAVTGTVAHSAVTAASWLNAKAVIAAIGAAVVACTGVFLVQSQRMENIRAENRNLSAQQQLLTAQVESVSLAERNREEELQNLQREHGELLRLRNEVAQLRRAQAKPGTSIQAPSQELSWSLDPKALAQSPPLVEIRPSPDQSSNQAPSGMISSGNGTIALRTYLRNIVGYAYDFSPTALNRIIMPSGTPEGWFDFRDTLPREGKEVMRQLLRDRFGLVAKRETRYLQTLLLKVDNVNSQGLKIITERRSAGDGGGSGVGQLGSQTLPGENRLRGEAISMAGLAAQLGTRLDATVLDQTGLEALYDYDVLLPANPSSDQVSKLLSEQLGLALTPGQQREPVEFLVVEKMYP
jgi:uncharacterized protein (TIGR03435 family)